MGSEIEKCRLCQKSPKIKKERHIYYIFCNHCLENKTSSVKGLEESIFIWNHNQNRLFRKAI